MTNQEQQTQTVRAAAGKTPNNAPATNSAPVKIDLAEQSNQQQQQQQQQLHLHQAPNCCASCLMPIKDRFIFNVINQNFHQECVRCADCSVGLNEKCFTQDGKLYCRVDYWRRFGPKCSACAESIKPTEFVQKLKQDLIYHLSCFVCQDCKRHLQAGEQLHLLDDKKILCKRDYLNSHNQAANQPSANLQPKLKSTISNNSSQSSQHCNNQENHSTYPKEELGSAQTQLAGDLGKGALAAVSSLAEDQLGAPLDEAEDEDADELDEDGASSLGADADQFQAGNPNYAGRAQQKGPASAIKFDPADCPDDLVDANGKRRGPRTTIKPKQLETLRRAFETASKPSRHIREQLAAETGLNMRVIQVWFQNRRSKERRMRNSNGSARRNFFRSSSRRLRVGPQALANQAPPVGNVAAASSLIASGAKERTGKLTKAQAAAQQQQQQQQQQNSPPMDTSAAGNKSNQSPSDFGGSSTGGSGGGGFTYFSDSSNQGNESSFAALASLTAGNQPQYSQSSNSNGILQQQSPPESVGNLTPTGAGNGLISLESPSGAGPQQSSGGGGKGASAASNQQQYQSSPMKNTPPPIYQQQQQPQMIHQQHLIAAPPQHHMMQQHMSGSHPQQHHHLQQQQQQHDHHHLHHAHHRQQLGLHGHHIMQPAGGMMGPGAGMPAGLMPGHPAQAGPPSVVQW